jgi:hypothetical protein
MAQQTSYTITAYNRVTQTYITLAHILAENSQEAKEKFIEDYYWQSGWGRFAWISTNDNISLVVQSPICR